MVVVTMPPTITSAKGRCASEPIDVESAAGNNPKPESMAVINTGLTRNAAPSTIESFMAPCSLATVLLINEIRITPS